MSFQLIENYGVIGNMRSIALVGMNGSIDFLCYPEFDSPTIFAALLDEDQGGRFQIEPCLTNVANTPACTCRTQTFDHLAQTDNILAISRGIHTSGSDQCRNLLGQDSRGKGGGCMAQMREVEARH